MAKKEKPKKTDFLSRFKHGTKCWTDQCAQFSNDALRKANFKISGDAWALNNVIPMYSGYKNLQAPLEYDSAKVSNHNKEAARNFNREFDSTKLDTLNNYALNIKHERSAFQERAFNESRQDMGTHTGFMTWDKSKNGKPGEWRVVHNIGGTVNNNKFLNMQNPNNTNAVTAIYGLKKKNAYDNTKDIFKRLFNLKSGGTIDFIMPSIEQFNKNFNNDR